MPLYYSTIETPVGSAAIAVDGDGAVVEFHLAGDQGHAPHLANPQRAEYDPERTGHVATQVAEFFARKRESFDLVLRPAGTPFQQKVWRALCEIPFGHVISYQQQARMIGDVNATQAVGAANGRNPIPLIIPCHRVIGKNGALVGFGCGIEMKRALLDFENPPLL